MEEERERKEEKMRRGGGGEEYPFDFGPRELGVDHLSQVGFPEVQ